MSREKMNDAELPRPAAQPENGGADQKLWLAGCFVITAIAALLRFWDLTLKPLHHDEGVNGFFLTTLFRTGVYKYDPANYHGPDLYYIALFFTKTFGLNTVSIRLSVGVFGVLTVVLAFYLKNQLGRIGSLAAGLFLALSPGMVFISRYFIHEMLFVFFSLGIVVALILFIEQRRARAGAIVWTAILLMVCFVPSAMNLAKAVGGDNENILWYARLGFLLIEAVLVFFVVRMLLAWDEGRPIYLLLAAACVVMLFATKETAFITLGTMVIACFTTLIWRKIMRATASDAPDDERALTWRNFRRQLGDSGSVYLVIAAAALIFIYVGILFFSSFFTYMEGVGKAFEAYAIWTKTGTKDHTQNPFWAYLKWGMKVESPILILSAVGGVWALIGARNRLAVFTAFWAFGMFAAYTLIPYKTPWLALSFLLPMCLIAGYGINEFWRSAAAAKAAGAVLAAAAVGVLAYQTYDANFVRYDDEEMPYVYAHTKREFLDLVAKIKYYADKSGKGTDATIEVVSPDYWSMPWYFNDYPHANFFGQMVDANTSEMIVAKKDDQDAEVIERYSGHYKYAGTYPLRPGVNLMLLVRRDLADADARELYQIEDE